VMEPSRIEIQGHEPAIVGETCERLVALESWCGGELVEPASAAFLRFGGRWHRLDVGGSTVSWREDATGPLANPHAESGRSLHPVDLAGAFGVEGDVLTSIDYVRRTGGAGVHLRFGGGRTVRFERDGRSTSYGA
jgi:hypothetical protein